MNCDSEAEDSYIFCPKTLRHQVLSLLDQIWVCHPLNLVIYIAVFSSQPLYKLRLPKAGLRYWGAPVAESKAWHSFILT